MRCIWFEESGGQIVQVARELSIWESTLGKWVRQAKCEAAGAPSVEERIEIIVLRRKLELVTREHDMLGTSNRLLLEVAPE